MPEVVDHGVTGFIVDDEQDGLQAIKRLPELDPSRVRAEFERRLRGEIGRLGREEVSPEFGRRIRRLLGSFAQRR